MMKSIIITVSIVALLVTSWFFYKNNFASEDTTKGKLVVGTDATYPPLEYLDSKGNIIGFDIDLAKDIAKELKMDIEIKNISFDKLFDALKNGEIDLIASSVTITTDRQKEMSFSAPYLNAGQIIVARGDSQIMDVEDLKNVKVGVQLDTTSQMEGSKYVDSKNLIVYKDYNQALSDLKTSKIEAIIIDYPAGVSMSQQKENAVKVVGKPFTSEFYGIVVAKNNTELLNKVNKSIATLKKNGRLDQLENIWFKR